MIELRDGVWVWWDCQSLDLNAGEEMRKDKGRDIKKELAARPPVKGGRNSRLGRRLKIKVKLK